MNWEMGNVLRKWVECKQVETSNCISRPSSLQSLPINGIKWGTGHGESKLCGGIKWVKNK